MTDARDLPDETRAERDERGHFLPGNRTSQQGGRRKGRLDLRRIACEQSEAEGFDLERKLWLGLRHLIEMMSDKDTLPSSRIQAARVVVQAIGEQAIDVRSESPSLRDLLREAAAAAQNETTNGGAP